MIITPLQAVRLYNNTFTPPVIGQTTDGEVYGESIQSALRNFLELPFMLSEGESSKLAPSHARYIKQRQDVAAFLRHWADQLEAL